MQTPAPGVQREQRSPAWLRVSIQAHTVSGLGLVPRRSYSASLGAMVPPLALGVSGWGGREETAGGSSSRRQSPLRGSALQGTRAELLRQGGHPVRLGCKGERGRHFCSTAGKKAIPSLLPLFTLVLHTDLSLATLLNNVVISNKILNDFINTYSLGKQNSIVILSELL